MTIWLRIWIQYLLPTPKISLKLKKCQKCWYFSEFNLIARTIMVLDCSDSQYWLLIFPIILVLNYTAYKEKTLNELFIFFICYLSAV